MPAPGARGRSFARCVACLCVLAVCAPVRVYGAAAGSVTPMPEARPQLVLPPKAVETRRMQRPGLMSTSAVRQDMAHLLFPHDGARFPLHGTITLGWMPPTEEVLVDTVRNSPVAYDVEISREGGWQSVLRLPVRDLRDLFSGMVQPPAPGRYQWQVYSIMANGQRIASQNRVFTVLP